MTYRPNTSVAVEANRLQHWSSRPRDDRTIERFAEALAECGSTNEAAKSAGITKDYGRALLARIKSRLGDQAR